MKTLTCILALAILVLGLSVTSSRADGGSTSYVVDSTFSSTTSMTPYSAPGDSFSFTFTEPSTCTCGPFTSGFSLNALVNYSFGGTTFTNVPATVIYAPSSLFGLFDIQITVGGVIYDWYLNGAQIYSVTGATATLLPGSFPVTPGSLTTGLGSFFYDTNGDFGALTGGSVTATSVAAMPEPSALLMLICGCLALAALNRKLANSNS